MVYDPDDPENLAKYEQWREEFEKANEAPWTDQRHLFPVSITERPLHETQVRAYALLAAANIPIPVARPAYEDLAAWEAKVLRTAARFERYINGKKNDQGSEEPPS